MVDHLHMSYVKPLLESANSHPSIHPPTHPHSITPAHVHLPKYAYTAKTESILIGPPAFEWECCRPVRIIVLNRVEDIKKHQAWLHTCLPQSRHWRQEYDTSWHISYFLGHGQCWQLSPCVLYHLAIAGSIIVPTKTRCHWPPSAMSTYRRGLVVIQGSGLWLLWVIPTSSSK